VLKQKDWTKNERLWTLVVNKINSNFFNLYITYILTYILRYTWPGLCEFKTAQLCDRKTKHGQKMSDYEYCLLTKKMQTFFELIACHKSHTTRTTRRRNIARVRSHYIPPKPAAPSRLFRILLFCFIVLYTKVTIINYYYYNIISTLYVFNQETRDSGFIFLRNLTITYFNLISCTIVWTFLNFQCFLVEINDYIYSATHTIYINSCCKFHFQT